MYDFKRLLAKLQPVTPPEEYVSDPYNENDMVNEVANASLVLNPEDIQKIYNAESSGGQFLRNPASSASGNFQLIDKTRNETLNDLKKQGIDDIPVNPLRKDALLMKTLLNKNENALLNSSTGPKDPDLDNLYLMHHFGIQGGLNALNNPNSPLSKKRFKHTRAQLAKPALTTIDEAKPAKNLLELLED